MTGQAPAVAHLAKGQADTFGEFAFSFARHVTCLAKVPQLGTTKAAYIDFSTHARGLQACILVYHRQPEAVRTALPCRKQDNSHTHTLVTVA
jgi:hypothetical protein